MQDAELVGSHQQVAKEEVTEIHGRGRGDKTWPMLLEMVNTSVRHTRLWGFTQSLTEMSTRSRKIMFLGSRVRPVRRADNLTTICGPNF
jgi:hypothetical protein